MTLLNLPIEFHAEVNQSTEELEREAEEHLIALSRGHSDMTGASISIERQAHGETPHLYRARVTVYVRPKNLHAQEKDESMQAALKGALDAIERQLREKREKRGETWKRKDLEDQAPPKNLAE
ncbi:MAG: HPF/RaiA family ribosome-associated protein [Anaerolineales bacterium]|jgi:ribosomal subunit interface protein